jgi:hypothetical protein
LFNTHQVLVGLPQRGWWPCYFIFILLYNPHQWLVGLPQGLVALLF